MQRLRHRIRCVAPTDATVLILGERGTGKELVAQAIHQASRRRDRAFVAVNCAALSSELFASELFGHERGAFTGAVDRSVGLVRAADGGTLFLDEVGDLSPATQAMLLRVLQEREVRPVGSTRTMPVDVRIVAATNKDLLSAAPGGIFRADALDRLREFVITVPPLRDRRDDLRRLVAHFLARQSARHGRLTRRLTAEAFRRLQRHDWPGNVRELEITISHAVIVARGRSIGSDDLGLEVNPADVEREPSSEEAERRQRYQAGGPGTDGQANAENASTLTPRQREAVRIAAVSGCVCRRDLTKRFGVSGEAVRRDLARLVRAGWLIRSGDRRRTVYRPASQNDGGSE
jgi:transcriptional regulator with GAF, ATPase, and Fis domain